jgi:hypothetical protein
MLTDVVVAHEASEAESSSRLDFLGLPRKAKKLMRPVFRSISADRPTAHDTVSSPPDPGLHGLRAMG